MRVAASIIQLFDQLNDLAPNRSRASDGTAGDPAHCPGASDHCAENCGGVVTAGDITHDPATGVDCNEITEAIRASRDLRCKYIIWHSRIATSYPAYGFAAWAWRPYDGSNPHDKHMHVSVHCNGSKDDTDAWEIGKDWDEMASKAEIRQVVREEVQRAVQQLAVGKEDNWNKEYMNLKDVEARLVDEIKKSLDGT